MRSFLNDASTDSIHFFMGFKTCLLPTTGTTLQPDRRYYDLAVAVGATRLMALHGGWLLRFFFLHLLA